MEKSLEFQREILGWFLKKFSGNSLRSILEFLLEILQSFLSHFSIILSRKSVEFPWTMNQTCVKFPRFFFTRWNFYGKLSEQKFTLNSLVHISKENSRKFRQANYRNFHGNFFGIHTDRNPKKFSGKFEQIF